MSTPGGDSSTSKSEAESKAASSKAGSSSRLSLRPLAPRPPLPPVRPVLHRTRTAPSLSVTARLSPNVCPLCRQRNCQLPTHKAVVARAKNEAVGLVSSSADQARRLLDSSYTKSYAYYYAQQLSIDRDLTAARVDPFFDLPIPKNGHEREMNRLFHHYFTVIADQTFQVRRPPECPTELTLSPFFVPAMTDTALCLAILAVSAALRPNQAPQPAGNVTVLTLVGQAMQCLRERFAAQSTYTTDTTILAAVYLWVINSVLNDTAAMRSHGASVYALVEGRGGLSRLGLAGTVAQFVRWADVMSGLTFTEPARYQDVGDPPPLPDPPSPVYGAFFTSMRATDILDAAVIEACLETCRLVELVERTSLIGPTTTQYLHIMATLCVHGTKSTILNARHHNSNSVNECVCLGRSLFDILVFCMPRQHQQVVLTLTGRLIRALRHIDGLTFWARDQAILMWLLFILALLPHEYDDRDWVMDTLYELLVSRFGREKWPDAWQAQIQQTVEQLVWSSSRLSIDYHRICRAFGHRTASEEDAEDDDDEGEEEDDYDDNDEDV